MPAIRIDLVRGKRQNQRARPRSSTDLRARPGRTGRRRSRLRDRDRSARRSRTAPRGIACAARGDAQRLGRRCQAGQRCAPAFHAAAGDRALEQRDAGSSEVDVLVTTVLRIFAMIARRRVALLDRNPDDPAAARLDDIAADDGIFGPVGALDEDVRLKRRDDRRAACLRRKSPPRRRTSSAASTSARSASAVIGRSAPLLPRAERSELTPTISASPRSRACWR